MQLGVHSEIGKLKKVMVSRPSLAHERLTPGNCHDLLFDDVIWVQKARSDHADFVLRMKDRGIDVYDIQDLLGEVFDNSPEGRAFVLDRRINENYVGPTFARLLRPWLDELEGHLLARHMLGGIVLEDLPKDWSRRSCGTCCRPASSSSGRFRTRSSSVTRPAGSTTD